MVMAGLALLLLGAALQACVGSLPSGVAAFPVNVCLLSLYVAFILGLHLLRGRCSVARWLSSGHAAVVSIVFAVCVTLCAGLTGMSSLLLSWPFVMVYAWVGTVLGLAGLRVVCACFSSANPALAFVRRTPFLLSHAGLFIAVASAAFGSADVQRLEMACYKGGIECRAIDREDGNRVVDLPFAIRLHRFELEEWPDHTPRRFASHVTVYVHDTLDAVASDVIEVNRPLSVGDWTVYQLDYDKNKGDDSHYSVFELVCDPWLPYVRLGIFMVVAGAVASLVVLLARSMRRWSRRMLSSAVAIILLALAMSYAFVPVLRHGHPVPALQSPWFAPHILMYMIAYALMAMAVVTALLRKPQTAILVNVGVSLMTLGMLFGALWAREAWGHYWAWDPKETWAAITWLTYLAFLHQQDMPHRTQRQTAIFLIVAFCLLQMCWWGINFLPSAQGNSLHTYT